MSAALALALLLLPTPSLRAAPVDFGRFRAPGPGEGQLSLTDSAVGESRMIELIPEGDLQVDPQAILLESGGPRTFPIRLLVLTEADEPGVHQSALVLRDPVGATTLRVPITYTLEPRLGLRALGRHVPAWFDGAWTRELLRASPLIVAGVALLLVLLAGSALGPRFPPAAVLHLEGPEAGAAPVLLRLARHASPHALRGDSLRLGPDGAASCAPVVELRAERGGLIRARPLAGQIRERPFEAEALPDAPRVAGAEGLVVVARRRYQAGPLRFWLSYD